MEGFKEFTGKSLDDAIRQACSFYDAEREQLEIDIVQDAKSGIFGLVGARKAIIRARKVQLRQAMEDILGRKTQEEKIGNAKQEKERIEQAADKNAKSTRHNTKSAKSPRVEKADKVDKADKDDRAQKVEKTHKAEKTEKVAKAGRAERHSHKSVESDAAHSETVAKSPSKSSDKPAKSERNEKNVRGRRSEPHAHKNRKEHPKHAPSSFTGDENIEGAEFVDAMDDVEISQRVPFEDLDKEQMAALSLEAVRHLVHAIVGDVPMQVEFHENRICVHLECGEDSGLLIGREGQTLAALQYVASRIVSRGMNAAVRVQLDAGDYRTRQDEKLRELALALADRVRNTGKSFSTRPLSSYHRRIVHMVLQDSSDILTRSSGDGALKRVIVQKKR